MPSHPESTLAKRQAELVSSIFGFKNTSNQADAFNAKGLAIYQNNLVMTATKALSISFPVLDVMVGSQAMVELARRLLHMTPPNTGDWADWGSDLHQVIRSSELIEEHPYLSDMAKLEWSVHCSARNHLVDFESDSLIHLSNQPLESVYLTLAEPVFVMSSPHPVAAIWYAHQRIEGELRFDPEVFQQQLNVFGSRPSLVIHSLPEPTLMPIEDDEFTWLENIQKGLSVSELLDHQPEFDFATWLSKAIREQLITRLYYQEPH